MKPKMFIELLLPAIGSTRRDIAVVIPVAGLVQSANWRVVENFGAVEGKPTGKELARRIGDDLGLAVLDAKAAALGSDRAVMIISDNDVVAYIVTPLARILDMFHPIAQRLEETGEWGVQPTK